MPRVLLTLCAVAVGVVLTGCGPAEREVRAVFDDVADLATSGHVKIADVPVGVVKAIELTDDEQALVTMELTREVALPAEVSARLRKTNLLGERFVELVPEPAGGGTFAWGGTITDTRTVPEFEEFIGASVDVLAAISVDTIAGALDAGAAGLTGRGQVLGTLLDDVTELVSTYDDNSDDLVRLVETLHAFLADVGPEAELHGEAFAELSRAAAVLRDEDERLLDTLSDVRGLAITGTDIMRTHEERIDAAFAHIQGIVTEIAQRDEELERVFAIWDEHNRTTFTGINAEHAQIFFDFIVCGVNDRPGDPVRSCHTPPQGRDAPPPREPRP